MNHNVIEISPKFNVMKGLILIVLLSFVSLNSHAAQNDGGNKGKKRHPNNNYGYSNQNYGYGYDGYNYANNDFICNSSLVLSLPNHGVFQVKIDNQRYHDLHNGQGIDNIPSGKRFIKIWQVRRPNHHGGHVEKVEWFKGFVVFNDCQVIHARINHNRHFIITHVEQKNVPPQYNQFPTVVIPNNTPQHPYCEHCMGYHEGVCGVSQPPLPPTHPPYYEVEQPPQGPEPMHPDSFRSFLTAVKDRTFDNSKLEIVEMGVQNNWFTSEQAYQLIKLFTFDSNKLDAAKKLYGKTVDQQNYTMVFELFTYDSNVKKLSRFMMGE